MAIHIRGSALLVKSIVKKRGQLVNNVTKNMYKTDNHMKTSQLTYNNLSRDHWSHWEVIKYTCESYGPCPSSYH
jgi:hypothetical protein